MNLIKEEERLSGRHLFPEYLLSMIAAVPGQISGMGFVGRPGFKETESKGGFSHLAGPSHEDHFPGQVVPDRLP